ncbi:MAG: protein kinase, partial [Pyrinomonadaceae bacterium]
MSPEQVRGRAVDHRSDIFSFGCVLYEAATGRKPFVGDSMVETLHKIISEPAPAITDSNPDAPAELQRIIRKCLAKEPEKRYQLIRETA